MEGKDIELRSEELQDVLGAVPSRLRRWGVTGVVLFIPLLLTGFTGHRSTHKCIL